ncbi:MAG TPA: HAD-IA family hydrolase [Chloroflexota bacterium]|nr:HAD-IA family hydrolase [Chloroflexota bacterium]
MRLAPRALFFDVGDTLVYPHPPSEEIIAAVCRDAGFAVTEAQVAAAEAATGPRLIERQASGGELYSISMENSRRFWTWVYAQIFTQLGVPEPHHTALAERLHAHFNAIETWRLYPDAIPTLEALQPRRHAGLKLGIISNWEDWLEALLTHLDVARYFDFAIISATIQLEKPDPAIFHAALDRAGVRPHEAVHIGDSVHADVEGALGVGVIPVLLDRRHRYRDAPTTLPTGTYVVDSLEELLRLVA